MRGDVRELLHSDPISEKGIEVRVKVQWQIESEKETSVTILDRQGLTEASCECYQLVRTRFALHLPTTYE
jgi:hypothetical protein